jgi:mannose-6-phosphate isomerase-like protein (cupin superfamily)
MVANCDEPARRCVFFRLSGCRLLDFLFLAMRGLFMLIVLVAPTLAAQIHEAVHLDRPFSCTMPVGLRKQDLGCYVLANETLRALPQKPLFWHLYTYPTLQAARQAKGKSTGTVAESLGKVWLFKIAPADWRPPGGKRIATVGPLPIPPASKFVARYMEGVIPPELGGNSAGRHTPVHRHPGPEAWYLLSGEQCMQTPGKTTILRAGETALVPGGVPMDLAPAGSDTRRSLVLVLHDASKPWMTKANDWKPSIACPQ